MSAPEVAYDRQSARPVSSAVSACIAVVIIVIFKSLVSSDFQPVAQAERLIKRGRMLLHTTSQRLLDSSHDFLNHALGRAGERPGFATLANKADSLKDAIGLNGASVFSKLQRATAGGRVRRGAAAHGPPGLGNWDNSCYQNSVIQGLASLRSMPGYLKNALLDLESAAEDCGADASHLTTTALRTVIDDLNNSDNRGQLLWIPGALKSMNSWQQQDAQEYFSKILDELEKEIARAVVANEKRKNPGLAAARELLEASAQSLNQHIIDTKQSDNHTAFPSAHPIAEGTMSHAQPAATRQRPFRSPLEGLLSQQVKCLQCGWSEGLSLIPFICLTLPLGKERNYTLEACLDEYTKLELIEGVECARCTLVAYRKQIEQIVAKLSARDTIADGSGSGSGSGGGSSGKTPSASSADESLLASMRARLAAVRLALDDDDLSDETLTRKFKIPARKRTTATKSRQAVIARPPQSLILHVNRSVFDELSGFQRKNYAGVRFPSLLDLGPWCLDFAAPCAGAATTVTSSASSVSATSATSVAAVGTGALAAAAAAAAAPAAAAPAVDHSREPPPPPPPPPQPQSGPFYAIKAVVTHYGRHENGHYICYRAMPAPNTDAGANGLRGDEEHDRDGHDDNHHHHHQEGGSADAAVSQNWWRISDDDVNMVSEEHVLDQGGVFMLFYERVDAPPAASLSSSSSSSSSLPSQQASVMNDTLATASLTATTTTTTTSVYADDKSSPSASTSTETLVASKPSPSGDPLPPPNSGNDDDDDDDDDDVCGGDDEDGDDKTPLLVALPPSPPLRPVADDDDDNDTNNHDDEGNRQQQQQQPSRRRPPPPRKQDGAGETSGRRAGRDARSAAHAAALAGAAPPRPPPPSPSPRSHSGQGVSRSASSPSSSPSFSSSSSSSSSSSMTMTQQSPSAAVPALLPAASTAPLALSPSSSSSSPSSPPPPPPLSRSGSAGVPRHTAQKEGAAAKKKLRTARALSVSASSPCHSSPSHASSLSHAPPSPSPSPASSSSSTSKTPRQKQLPSSASMSSLILAN